MMLFLLLVALTSAAADDLPPTCSRPVYCNSTLLHHIQMARLYPDSKTFVDLQMRNDENTTLAAFEELFDRTNGSPSKEELRKFVADYFDETSELEEWTPNDYKENPPFLNNIRDERFREFAKGLNDIWPTIARRVKPSVLEKPDQFSLVPLTHGFIVPGGRFKEIYYWDAYWIIEGLLITDMHETAKGMIENLIELLHKFGHIPNGSRWYYQERSQPPLLAAMMERYYEKTKDIKFIKKYISSLEKEINYWLDTQLIAFNKDDRVFTLLRYYTPSAGPRPESYYEDYDLAQKLPNKDPNDVYTELKSAAESGWDFSSRWFISENGDNSGNLTNLNTTNVIPVDLNAIFAGALQTTANFHAILNNPRKAAHWGYMAEQWRSSIEHALWDEEDGIWHDYDIVNNKPRRYFYTSNLAPLWMNAVDQRFLAKHGARVLEYLHKSEGIEFPGGVPVSLANTGEQWDFPNAWPPEVSIFINGIQNIGSEESSALATKLAQVWVRACYKGFSETKQMFEKYDALNPGKFGGGGEYTVQAGFGWSNGVILEFLDMYGDKLTSEDTSEVTE
uniref:Trehalase n=1 Tax=Rondotia menciana TaxID=1221527 RepID=A0A876UGM4_9NEOP|nr:Trehalase 1A [Rondotia menciana]